MTFDNDEEVQYCKWHPKTETRLTCYQCGTPICTRCAHRTAVGYICPDCLRGRQQRYDQSRPTDYLIALALSLALGVLASILPLLGWYVLLLSPLAGMGIGEVVWRTVGRRYGRHLWWVVGATLVASSGPVLLLSLWRDLALILLENSWGSVSLLWVALHIPLIVGAAIARLRM